MKLRLLRALLFVLAGYLLVVLSYFIYLETGGQTTDEVLGLYKAGESSFMLRNPDGDTVRNYATLQLAVLTSTTIEQKYEKVGDIQASSRQYADDEKKVRAAIGSLQAVVQEEALVAESGVRRLRLTLGVPPAKFDAAMEALRTCGNIERFTTTKTDKTNDFLQLRAKKATLEKTRAALLELKTRGGDIGALIKAEQELLTTEGNLQSLDVQLGQFDPSHDFCTVHYALVEIPTRAAAQHPHWSNWFRAMSWASPVYAGVLAATVAGMLCLLLLVIVVEKAKRALTTDRD